MGLLINALKEAEKDLSHLIKVPAIWKTLDVDYFPPRVERLWLQYNEEYRLFIHLIHPTTEDCLFHKHRWPAAFKMIHGQYEMGISFSEKEVSSEEAYTLSILSSFLLSTGSYYEMSNTNTLHYVKPLKSPSLSLMLTGQLYPEASYRKENLTKSLHPLSDVRKNEILKLVREYY